jgi:D-alanyl-lipoteichoic acid acyltransferase DltB (MBOAT superfamily)
LILFVTIVVDYFAGIWIENAKGKKRTWLLVLSLISNIGFLAYFKYFNFFVENINDVFFHLGSTTQLELLKILLPIGLSFHTFQAMSYTIEVYRGNEKAEKDFAIYALYVMFYPQLVAGPIERPQNVLWQFHKYFEFDFENLKAGLMRMAWGMFKKVVIADRLAMVVDYSFDNPYEHNGFTLLAATVFFTFQIYCDFSGYSDIAIGAARVMGFKLMENFEAPYFSKSINEFWRRWHISLSGWFRDYLYIPLGGNRVGEFRKYFNLFFVFMLSGLWHGAAWTYIIWGALHGIYLVLAQIRKKYNPVDVKKYFSNNILNIFNLAFTFMLVMLTWVFFRAKGLSNAKIIISKILHIENYGGIVATPFSINEMIFCWFLIAILMIKDKFMMHINTQNTTWFYLKFTVLLVFCYFFGIFTSNQFIYFQF